MREGSEEYLDSEKYEAKQRKLDGPLLPLVQRLNEIRRAEPALQRVDNLRWLETEQPLIVGYVKDDLVVVVNVDPTAAARRPGDHPRRARATADVLRPRPPRRRALPVDDRPQLRPPRPGPGAHLQARDACLIGHRWWQPP